MFIIEKETPSQGGWSKSTFEVIAKFESYIEAEDFLYANRYIKLENKFDTFWQTPVKWPWDQYRIKVVN